MSEPTRGRSLPGVTAGVIQTERIVDGQIVRDATIIAAPLIACAAPTGSDA